MKVKTIAGRKMLVVTYREKPLFGGGWRSDASTINVFREGRKILFTHEDPNSLAAVDGTYEDANIAAGAKTFVRLLQAALDGKTVKSQKNALAGTYYASEPTLRLEREGNRILFTAPCGQEGYITVREAEKLVAEIPTL